MTAEVPSVTNKYTRSFSWKPTDTPRSSNLAELQRQIEFQDLEIECYRAQLFGAGKRLNLFA